MIKAASNMKPAPMALVPLANEISTGGVLSHMPTVNGTAMSIGSFASLAATNRCWSALVVTTRAVSAYFPAAGTLKAYWKSSGCPLRL